MKTIWLYVFVVIFLLSSCGENKNNQPQQPAENIETVPGIEKMEFTDSLKLEANENMRFDKELFRVKAGKKICIILKNTSVKSPASMTHNVVVLKNGVDIADFADVAHKAKNEQYVPSSLNSLIIAHTKMVSGGESDTVAFTMPQPGVYDFICSFPGHWGTMQGKIVAQ
ncbi:MAG TPA: plastocyanin/azurin family copper-binding protein [Puia sp.]|jgi:azurin|nr:plastocyanin/azurin family copper-binding protein [Puia sp.]